MKFNGKSISKRKPIPAIFPRGDGETIILLCGTVNFDDFEGMIPMPKPKMRTHRDGSKTPIVDEPVYLAQISQYADRRVDWMALKSLQSTEGLEWETVEMSDPATWGNYKTELKQAGFADLELVRLVRAIHEANGLSDSKIEEATKDFFDGTLVAGLNLYTRPEEPSSTQSGEVVSD